MSQTEGSPERLEIIHGLLNQMNVWGGVSGSRRSAATAVPSAAVTTGCFSLELVQSVSSQLVLHNNGKVWRPLMQMPHVCHCFVVQYLDLPICFSLGSDAGLLKPLMEFHSRVKVQTGCIILLILYISKSHFRQEKKKNLLILSLVLFLSVVLDLTWWNKNRKDCNAEYEEIHLEYHESWMHNLDLHQLWSLEVLRIFRKRRKPKLVESVEDILC